MDQNLKLEQEKEESYGLMILKPDALSQGLVPVVESLLSGNNAVLLQTLEIPKLIKDKLNKVTIVKSFFRDISSPPYNSNSILDIFYREFRGKRQYPIMMAEYNGPLMFFLIKSDSSKRELDEVLKSLKGLPLQKDNSGNVRVVPTGLRGAFMDPLPYYDKEELKSMTEEEYSNTVPLLIRNLVHTADSDSEIAEALYGLLNDSDLEEIENRGIPIRKYVDLYYPRNIQILEM